MGTTGSSKGKTGGSTRKPGGSTRKTGSARKANGSNAETAASESAPPEPTRIALARAARTRIAPRLDGRRLEPELYDRATPSPGRGRVPVSREFIMERLSGALSSRWVSTTDLQIRTGLGARLVSTGLKLLEERGRAEHNGKNRTASRWRAKQN